MKGELETLSTDGSFKEFDCEVSTEEGIYLFIFPICVSPEAVSCIWTGRSQEGEI